jgi:hypothetical protein
MAVQKEIMSIPDFGADEDDALFAAEKKVLRNLKKAVLMVAGASVQKFTMKLAEEQEIIMDIADMMMEVYVSESTLLRTEKLIGLRGEGACARQIDMTKLYLNDAVERIGMHGRNAINSFAEGDEQRVMLMGLKRFTKIAPINAKETRRRIADQVIGENAYTF